MFSKLLNQIDYYLLGLIYLNNLEDWLVEHLQEILDSGEQAAIEMANQIDADFAEYSQGILDEQTIYNRLRIYFFGVFTVNFQFGEFTQPQQNVIIGSSVNRVIESDISIMPGADLKFPALQL